MGRRKVSGRVQDPTGRWRTRVGKLADALGWTRPRLYSHWSQLALKIEFSSIELGLVVDRHVIEFLTFRVLEMAVTKQEGEPS